MKLKSLLVGLAAFALIGAAAADEPIVIKFSHVVAQDTPKGKAADLGFKPHDIVRVQ